MEIHIIQEQVRQGEYEISFHAEKERYAEDISPNGLNGKMSGQEEQKERPMHNYGDCSFCGGEVKAEVAELDYRYKGNLYVFREVPVGICQQCGEKYLVASTAKAIEHEIRTQKEWRETVSVPVTTFSEINVPEANEQIVRE